MSYVIIPFINVQRANALAAPWLVSPLPVFAATMLGHALGCDIEQEVTGVAYLHHSAELLVDRDLPNKRGDRVYASQFRGATFIDDADYSSKNKNALSIQPSISTHLLCSLVLRLSGPAPSVQKIKDSLTWRRLSGGLIIDHGKIVSVDHLSDVMKKLDRGFFAVDRSHLLYCDNPVEKLLLETNPPSPYTPDQPWRTATVLGYSAVTDFAQREGVRDNQPHAFAEALVGLVDLVSARHIADHLDQDVFWSGQWVQDRVFLLSHQSVNNEE